ncbi:MAG: 1-(5-phosphoribosyl)-5-((5-phosphoribosylamino)methylideneamino)imidazole-4-carboxamide isomerase, partial [Chloroflexota bacterium]
SGAPVNADLIATIARAVPVPLQVGGGIRSEAVARAYWAAGVERVVLGTAAVRDITLVQRLVARAPERVVVAVDARDGIVRVDGWTAATDLSALDLVGRMVVLGVRRFLYTDIARDGSLTEPNVEALRRLVAATPAPVIASGGVARVAHVRQIAACGAAGVIIGRALYTGDVDLVAALAVAAEVADRHLGEWRAGP